MAFELGEVEGIQEGRIFQSRKDIYNAGLHRNIQAGIACTESGGADSIVLSGGYEDDEDFGDVIIYTGQGGNRQGRQIADQEFRRGNRALAVSRARGLPVRVIRMNRIWQPQFMKKP